MTFLMLQAKIIRDADKVDIMNLLQYKPFQLLYKKADISDEKLSDAVYEQILNKKLIKNSNGNSSNIDKWVWTIAFIYDLNFEYSFQEIKKRNYIENLINRIDYKDEQTKQRMEKIKKISIEDIEEKIKK